MHLNVKQISIDRALQQANEHKDAGRFQAAEAIYRGILSSSPGHLAANRNLGELALRTNRPEMSVQYLKVALDALPTDECCWLAYIDALVQSNQSLLAQQALTEAKNLGFRGVALAELQRRIAGTGKDPQPESAAAASVRTPYAGAWLEPQAEQMRTVVDLFHQRRFREAESLAAAIAERFPQHPFGWKALGATLRELGRLDEAVQPLRMAVQLAGDAESHCNLGLVLQEAGYPEEAVASFRKALEGKPDLVEAHCNLGRACLSLGQLSEAEASLRRAIRIKPDLAEAHNTLGVVLQEAGRWLEAEKACRRAIELRPNYVEAHINLGASLCSAGRLSEAESSFRAALLIRPDDPDAFSNLLYLHNYRASQSPEQCAAEARQFGQVVGRKAGTSYASFSPIAATERLRIGLVSGDLRSHPVGYFAEGLLAQLDSSRLEFFAYPTQHNSDALTTRIRPHFLAWKPLVGLSDEVAARLIHTDGIHVLIDLSGHTAHNRLPVFGWKPAPVQVSWLGYFATTGVAQIDYLLADAISVPPEHHSHFTESIWYLPETRLCFTPPDIDLAVAPLPALTNSYITFGNFQNLTKLGDEVLALWSQIMAALPSARLRIQNKQLADVDVRRQFSHRLYQAGIAPERASLHGPMPRRDYLAAHAEVDLMLDSFPFPGGTTTCEALWMGVPTLTLAGDRLIARQGASLLAAAGLPAWITQSKQEYIDKALRFARDVPALAAMRSLQRLSVLRSPLFDARRFAQHFESALWQMWRLHAAAHSSEA